MVLHLCIEVVFKYIEAVRKGDIKESIRDF
jgi:hypothetical protein